MSKPQQAGEPSMDDILASIRRMISDDRPAAELDPEPDALQALGRASDDAFPAPGLNGGSHAPVSSGALSSNTVAFDAQPAAGERVPATFNSLADALKVAAAHSERRLSADRHPEPAAPEMPSAQVPSFDPFGLVSAPPSAPVPGKADISLPGDAWAALTSDSKEQSPAEPAPAPAGRQLPEFPEAQRSSAPVASAPSFAPAPKASERPDLLGFDFGTIVTSRDAGVPGIAPLPVMPSASAVAARQPSSVADSNAAKAPDATVAPVREVAATIAAPSDLHPQTAVSAPVVAPTPASVAPVSAESVAIESHSKPTGAAAVASAATPVSPAVETLVAAAGPIKPIAEPEKDNPLIAEAPARQPLAGRINGHPQTLPRPSFNRSLNGTGADPLRSPEPAQSPLSNGVNAEAKPGESAVAKLGVDARPAAAAPPTADTTLTTSGRVGEPVVQVQPLTAAPLNGLSNGNAIGGGVVAPFPRLLQPREVAPFQPPLTSKGGGWPGRPVDDEAAPAGTDEVPFVKATSPAIAQAPAPASPTIVQAASVVPDALGDAAQAKADALLDAVVDLVQQQPGALSVLTSGASFIGGVDGPKPGLPALSEPHLLASSPAPQKLDRAAAELLRPMLRQWLAENMPRIVEEALRSELNEQLSGSRSTPDKK
ncbi:DUF2497 domain-containing protein [Hyphomicrobium sp. D-2]|uniref:DUF2497 domain-containing protein n=1 Tax=Hyphomicrobium sp. D-2 TaxID=3041621 RepID=UPI0024537C1A|nr:DUF2497 domain-containing protein [Hyphomicrobium sp. D-2]MDH4982255.1 DUF2497 domain-containing protein [Hyphomicrobium sp. D-2]